MRAYLRPILIGLSALLAASAAMAQEDTNRTLSVDGYAAIVNERVILASDVEAAAAPLLQNLARAYEMRLRETIQADTADTETAQRALMAEFDERARDARARALDALVERALIIEEFERQEGEMPERMVKDQLERIIQERFGGDRGKLVSALTQQQMTMEEFTKQTKDDLIAMLLRRQEMGVRPGVAPQTVLDLYNERIERYRQPAEVKLRGIALGQGENEAEREAKRKLAETLRHRILEGEDFSTIASAHSEGSRAAGGGDWGWRNPDDLRAELAEAARTTEPGSLSEIIDVQNEDGGGWFYILQVEARKNPAVTPFDQVRDDLRAELEHEAEEALYKAWIERLKKHHFVRIY